MRAHARLIDAALAYGRFDVAALERNKAFATQLSKDVAAGRQSFYQALRVGVPNMQEAVTFWTRGCGALVLDTRLVGGANVTRVGFGPQSFGQDDGAKFALELVEGASSSYEADGPLQYVQLAIPVFRLSQVRRGRHLPPEIAPPSRDRTSLP